MAKKRVTRFWMGGERWCAIRFHTEDGGWCWWDTLFFSVKGRSRNLSGAFGDSRRDVSREEVALYLVNKAMPIWNPRFDSSGY